MARDYPSAYESGDLSICPKLGQVTNSQDESVRLGPVNMKVLAALLGRGGQIVTRSELFETVWGNQLVGEDALTRCISDIRAELRKLSGQDDLIETLPKRGYRWAVEVRESRWKNARVEPPIQSADPPVTSERQSHFQFRLLSLAARSLAYLFALVAIASVSIWLADVLSGPRLPVIAVLPVSADASRQDFAAEVENQLTDYLIRLDRVEVLSRSAVASRPENPFPFFYFEFGARWLVEAELQSLAGRVTFTLAVVDARTGIVLMQHAEPIVRQAGRGEPPITQFLRELELFIDSQTSLQR